MKNNKPAQIIGALENVAFPEMKLHKIQARIDTGARTSAIWASSIRLRSNKLQFVLFGIGHPFYNGEIIETAQFARITVKPSNGISEERYVIKLLIVLMDRRLRVSFTLADRSSQTYPILLGRNILKDRFIVDISVDNETAKHDVEVAAEISKSYAATEVLQSATNRYEGRKLRIAILSKGSLNYTTKRLREVSEARGHEVVVVNYAKCYMTMERSKPVIYYKGEILAKFDAIIPRIAQSYTKYGTAVVRQFEMQGSYTTASSIAINRSRDKLRSYQIMARNDVAIPKTVFARETANLDEVVELAGGAPVIIKVARGTHGNGVVLAETRKAAVAVMQAFYVEGVNFMVQEFVAESAGTDIRVLVVGGRVVASIERRSLDDDFRSNTHQGGVGKAVKLSLEEEKMAIKAAKAMGLPVCGVDMMRSKDGPKVLEVNSSASIMTPERVTKRDVATKII